MRGLWGGKKKKERKKDSRVTGIKQMMLRNNKETDIEMDSTRDHLLQTLGGFDWILVLLTPSISTLALHLYCFLSV